MRRTSVLVLGIAAGLSCGDADKAKNEFISQFCDALRPCCSAVGLRADGQFCRISVTAALPPTYDDAAGRACLDAVRATSADPATCLPDPLAADPCKPVFAPSGSVAPGGSCARDSDCAPAAEGAVVCATGYPPGGNPIRKCQVELIGQPGSAPCIWTVDGSVKTFDGARPDVEPMGYLCHVESGLRCDGVACVELKPPGQVCATTAECEVAAYCDTEPAEPICAARKPQAAPCLRADECAAGLTCIDATLTCDPRLDLGAACTASHECLSDNCADGTCRAGLDNLPLIVLCGEG